MKSKKKAKKKMEKVEKLLCTFHAEPNVFVYMNLYQAMQGLYFQGKYDCVSKLCDALLTEAGD